MNTSDPGNKQRNREIAENEAERQIVGDVRVSAWALVATVVAGLVVFLIVWVWINR